MLRRVLAAACAAGAVLGVLAVVRAPEHAATRPVVVSTRALAVGEVLDAGAVRVVRWPADLAPPGAVGDRAEAIGRRAGTPVGAGEALTRARLSSASLLDGQPPGTVAVHVALADVASAAMVEAGQRVDLLGPGGPVARDLTVLRVDAAAAGQDGLDAGLGRGLPDPADVATGMVVAADPRSAAALAAAPLDALGRPSLTVVLLGG